MGKREYYIIWVEGLSCRTGEKVNDLTDTGVDYTTSMTKALRIRKEDYNYMEHYLKRHGIRNATYIITSYAPKGTLYKFPPI
jgi:hypothetical protein